jgi:hypothetical protein
VSFSKELSEKSVQAAISAIEIYNKPDFRYREEAFSLLMINAWELLLKAKWLLDHGDDISSLHVLAKQPDGTTKTKTNRAGNPLTHGLTYLLGQLVEDTNSGLEKPGHDNILAMMEVRDNSAHFFNKDKYFGRRILELGTASLRNYVQLATEWFQIDLSAYHFFLMPISFYHGFESASPLSNSLYPEQVKNLLQYIDSLQEQDENLEEDSSQNFTLTLQTQLVRGGKDEAIPFKWTNDPSAPAITLREEDVLQNYPFDYKSLTAALRKRYTDFVENRQYHKLRKEIEKEDKFCLVRLLDPKRKSSTKKRFYNPNIFTEFDKHYTKRKKS